MYCYKQEKVRWVFIEKNIFVLNDIIVVDVIKFVVYNHSCIKDLEQLYLTLKNDLQTNQLD